MHSAPSVYIVCPLPEDSPAYSLRVILRYITPYVFSFPLPYAYAPMPFPFSLILSIALVLTQSYPQWFFNTAVHGPEHQRVH